MTQRLALVGRALARSVTAPLRRPDRRTGAVDGLQAVDVAAMAGERGRAWSALADEHGVHLTVRSPKHAYAFATPGHLEQALDNLISNAIDASPAGGTVVVAVRGGEGDTLHVHVVDDGPGMDAIGLPTVANLVRADGGGVSLGRAPGGGLDAHMTLRRAPGPSSARRRRISEPARS